MAEPLVGRFELHKGLSLQFSLTFCASVPLTRREDPTRFSPLPFAVDGEILAMTRGRSCPGACRPEAAGAWLSIPAYSI